tara:strand:- start:241 stop:429 length:189 start_codon:yes stop_codon:yes gene_type:complete
MDGVLMNALHGSLHRLSKKSWKKLKKYYAKGTLSSKARRSILKEITKAKDTFKAASQLDSKN